MAVGEDVVGADGLTNRERFEMRREQKRQEKAAREAAAARAAEAARQAAEARAAHAAATGGMLSTQQPAPSAPVVSSWDAHRYNDLISRGVINEQGQILKPGGINPTEFMRGEAPSWATPELIKNAYLLAFESQARGGQNFMDGGDYQNFVNAGFNLTDEQIKAIGGVKGQGNQNSLTFGGGQTTTGVATAASMPSASSPDAPASKMAQEMLNYDFKERDAYKSGKATPFMDAYLRSREAATKEGPVSSLFKDMLKGS